MLDPVCAVGTSASNWFHATMFANISDLHIDPPTAIVLQQAGPRLARLGYRNHGEPQQGCEPSVPKNVGDRAQGQWNMQ